LSLLWNSNTSGATSPPNLTNHQINLKYLLTSTSISQIEKWLKIVLNKLAAVYNPCTSDFVLSVKEGVIRTVGHTMHKKEPITPEILKQIVTKYGIKYNFYVIYKFWIYYSN
jgi:hypothetical protein